MKTASSASPGAFVGRESEMQVLRAAVEAALAGRGRCVLLSGEPGIGKTRTAEELANMVRQRGGRVLWGRCYEGEGAPPFWPWVQVLRTGMKSFDSDALRDALGADAADLAHIVPAIREQLPDLPQVQPSESPEARFRLFDSVVHFLGMLAQQAPLVVVLDDLHGADRSSLLLLEFVVRALRELPLLVLGTHRDVGMRHEPALTETLVDLAREPGTERLVLRGLSVAEIAEFVKASAGAEPPAALVTQLYRRTEGNPLFVSEFVQVLLAEGRVREHTGSGWNVAVPSNVQAVIGRRLAPLSAACREVLRTAAVIGREFRLSVLKTTLGDHAGAALVATLEEAVAVRVIESLNASGGYRFAHALIRETLYEGIAAHERAPLHRQVGEAIERLPEAEDSLAELAYHFFEAGHAGASDKAIGYAQRAGDRARASLAYEEATRLYQLGLQVLDVRATAAGGGTADAQRRCTLLIALGEVQQSAGDKEGSKQTILHAVALARDLGERELLARAVLAYGVKLPWGEGGTGDETLLELLEEALRGLGDEESAPHVRLQTRLATALRFTPERPRGLALSERALAMARRLNAPTVVADALNARHVAMWSPDNVDERLAIAAELIALGEQTRSVEIALLGHIWRLHDCYELGDRATLDAELGVCRRLAERLREPHYTWWIAGLTVAPCTLEGRFAEAEERAQEALRLGQSVNAGAALVFAVQMFELQVTRGQAEAVAAMVAMFEAAVAAAPELPVFRAILAFAYCAAHRVPEARAEFERLAESDFAALPFDDNWFACISYLVEVCIFLKDAARAAVLYDVLTPFHTRAAALAAAMGYRGPVAHYLGMLATFLSRWDDAAHHFEHALAMNLRMRARPWLAQTQYEYARMLLGRGEPHDQQRAHTLLEEAVATARELDMPLLIERVEALSRGEHSPIESQQETQPVESAIRIPQSAITAVFRRDGDYWTVAYADSVVRLKDSRGLQYLAHLLRHPGQEILVIDLAQSLDNGDPGSRMGERTSEPIRAPRSPTPALDAPAKAAYKRRLEALRDELSEAEANNDLGRAEQARSEMDMLAEQLRGALGLGGRDRPVANDLERARSAVGKRLRAEIKRIRSASPALGRHLAATVTTGYFCAYEPERDIAVQWEL